MYKKIKPRKTTIDLNQSYKGERIEVKVERIVNNKEPISDGAPIIYTERKDGVLPEFNIRTDRFEVAVEAMDKVSKSHIAKREEVMKSTIKEKEDTKNKNENKGKETGGQPTQTTDNK